MIATEILYQEHRIILKVLECLEKLAQQSEKEKKVDAAAAQEIIDFIRNFADGCHHSKEEDRLFVVMQEKGVPREGGPIGVMLMEHDSGRRYVAGMMQSLDQAAAGDGPALEQFIENARDLIELLRLHIDKEDEVLFPMADRVMDQPAGEALLHDFREIEARAGGQRHATHLATAQRLCERFGVEFLDPAQITAIRSQFLEHN